MEFDRKKLQTMSPFEIRNELSHVAKDAFQKKKKSSLRILNAGRGNPNFLHTTTRKSFCKLTEFAIDLSDTLCDLDHVGKKLSKTNIAQKLFTLLKKQKDKSSILLYDLLTFAIKKFSFDPDEFILEMLDASLGDHYPEPPRILTHVETIAKAYITYILCPDNKLPKGNYQLFATEGAAAAMFYLFHSFRLNHVLKPGDHIALITPIFSPYLEMPILKDYRLVEIFLEGKEELDWQLTDQELQKLYDPKIKALYLVNPTNPTAVSIQKKTLDKIKHIVQTKRKDLIILCDTVYATFLPHFQSFLKALPHNTVSVYSYSKYFGVTGWRLGLILMQENHVVDQLIQKLPKNIQKTLHNYYKSVSLDPHHIPFIDRLLIDSRDPPLAHTGGLSRPQQCLLALFSLFELHDTEKKYRKSIHGILKKRIQNLYKNLGLPLPKEEGHTYYYSLINIETLAKKIYGKSFAEYLCKHYMPLDFLFRLAAEKFTICLPGQGFGGPAWSLRISLANLDDVDYIDIGKNIKSLLDLFYKEYQIRLKKKSS